MTSTRKTDRKKLEYQYTVGETILKKVNLKRHLGVWIDDELSFKEHVYATTRKAYQMLGFIFPWGKFFNDPGSMLILYNSLVRSRLEYIALQFGVPTMISTTRLSKECKPWSVLFWDELVQWFVLCIQVKC